MSWMLAATGCGRCLGQSWCHAPRTTDGVCAKPDACRHVAGLCSPALWPIGSARGLVRRPLRFRPSTCRRGRRDVRHSVGCTDPCLAGRDHRPGGQAALRRLGNLLGGVEANWPVASTEESVDIERRRVFEPVAVDAARAGKMVTASYGEHHATRARQFPFECRARDYPRVESVTAYTASRSPVPSSRITSTDSSATGPSWLPADPRSPGPHGQSYPQTVDVQQCQPEARRPTRASSGRVKRRLAWLSP